MMARSLKLAIWLVSDRPKRADEELALNAIDFHIVSPKDPSPAAVELCLPNFNAPLSTSFRLAE